MRKEISVLSKTFKQIAVGAAALLSLGTATLASTSADAFPWAPVVGAGVLGVAVGASLAHPYYGPPPAYYAGPGYYGYYHGCHAHWRWSPRWGRYVRVGRCY
jgi:hypothetical protein